MSKILNTDDRIQNLEVQVGKLLELVGKILRQQEPNLHVILRPLESLERFRREQVSSFRFIAENTSFVAIDARQEFLRQIEYYALESKLMTELLENIISNLRKWGAEVAST